MHFTLGKHCALGKGNPTLTPHPHCTSSRISTKAQIHQPFLELTFGARAQSTPVLRAHTTSPSGCHFPKQQWFLLCAAWPRHPLESSASENEINISENSCNNNKIITESNFGKKKILELLASSFSPTLYCSIISIFIFSGSCYRNLHNRDELPHTANTCEHLLATTGHEPARKLNSDPT